MVELFQRLAHAGEIGGVVAIVGGAARRGAHFENAEHVSPVQRWRKAFYLDAFMAEARRIEADCVFLSAEYQRAALLVLTILFLGTVEKLAAALCR